MSVEARTWVGTAFRLVLSGIWFWSGLAKMLEPDQARRDAIAAYRVFPASWVGFLSWALPAVEIGLAVLLLLGLLTRLAAIGTALLMVGFIVGISSVWIRGYSIDCGCFGGGGPVGEEGKTWRYTSELLRDFLFTGMAVWLVAWPRTRFSLDAWIAGPPIEAYADSDGDSDEDDSDSDSDSDHLTDSQPLEEHNR